MCSPPYRSEYSYIAYTDIAWTIDPEMLWSGLQRDIIFKQHDCGNENSLIFNSLIFMVIYVETVAKKIARNIHICRCKNKKFVCVGMNDKDITRDKEHCNLYLVCTCILLWQYCKAFIVKPIRLVMRHEKERHNCTKYHNESKKKIFQTKGNQSMFLVMNEKGWTEMILNLNWTDPDSCFTLFSEHDTSVRLGFPLLKE